MKIGTTQRIVAVLLKRHERWILSGRGDLLREVRVQTLPANNEHRILVQGVDGIAQHEVYELLKRFTVDVTDVIKGDPNAPDMVMTY